jgi:serine acetyltransferase/thymidylate kinase
MDDRCHVLQALFDFLEREGVDYCVVGDTRRYPQEIASDVDIVVRPAAFAGIARTIARFCRVHDVQLVQMIQHEQTAVYFVLAWHSESGQLRFLAPDFCSDYFRDGRRLLSAEEVLTQRELAVDDLGSLKGLYVPPPHMQFIYYLLKKVDKLDLGEHHADYLSNQWREDAGGAWGQICRFWPSAADAGLLAHAAAMNQWSAVREMLPRLRRSLRQGVPLSAGWVLRECRRRIARVLRPTGLTVVFLGPDGSGKSSVIERVLADLAPVFRRTQYLHLRPRVLAGGQAGALPVAHPHALAPRGTVASIAKLAWLLLDYVVGYALRVWPSVCRSTLVAFDRYFHDLLIDPQRYRYGGSLAFARWAARCVPAPDMWVLLDAPAAVLQARKSEVTAEESERQREEYLHFIRTRREAVVVDASRELNEVAADVARAVLDFLSRRLETRYPHAQVEENPLRTRVLLFFCRHRVPALSKLFRIIFNSDIYCRIRSPILMPHPYGIVIHSKAVIGRRVTVMQQVTIGGKNPGGENAAPVIEDDVYIGTGAKIIGNARVGRGTVVGANAVVTRDVPPYCTVVGANRIVNGGATHNLEDRIKAVTEDRGAAREPLSA